MLSWAVDLGSVARIALIEAAYKFISVQPERVTGWLRLGNLLIDAGRFEEATDALSDGAVRLPTEPKVYLLLAEARRRAGEFDAALVAAETAFSLAPHIRATVLKRFDLLVEMRSWDRVLQDLDDLTMTAPTRRSVIVAHEHFARSASDPEALLAACEAALARQCGHTEALHRKAIALFMLGRNVEARAIISLDDFVRVGDLPARDERIGSSAFLDVLADEILRNPTLVPDPHGKSTRDGLQSRVLMQAGDKAVPQLLEQIKSAVERYVEALPPLSHPFASARPEHVRLNAWAVVYPQDGRQKSHLHPSGWISGVAYVAAPRAAGKSDYRGPLVLGELDAERYPGPPPWGTREIEPIPGRIVLFPSFVPHATRPTGLVGQRICVAFDVAPA